MKVIQKNGKIYLQNTEEIISNIIMEPPKNFSLINNTEETVDFFNQVITVFNSENFNGTFVFNLNKIKCITADAIMYMNALALNRLSTRSGQKILLGWPKNKKCKNFLKRCGIKKYLSSGKGNSVKTNNYYTITGGKKADVDCIREIGLFTCDKLNIQIKDLDFITSTFVELMNNTEQHAYDINVDKFWYVFIEDTKTSVKYTFLDTGKGIPETMRKSFSDNIHDLLPIIEEDHSYFIFEALKGDIPRSSSEKAYRNTGLPEIYKNYKEKKLSKLKIISCRGVCTFHDSSRSQPNLKNMKVNFCGTLFTWEVKK